MTIEELAKPIAIDFICKHKGKINNDAPLTHECVQYTIERIFTAPLAQRLTDAEKEMVREEYDEARIFSENVDPCVIEYAKNKAEMSILERIFGKDFFQGD